MAGIVNERRHVQPEKEDFTIDVDTIACLEKDFGC